MPENDPGRDGTNSNRKWWVGDVLARYGSDSIIICDTIFHPIMHCYYQQANQNLICERFCHRFQGLLCFFYLAITKGRLGRRSDEFISGPDESQHTEEIVPESG